MNLLNKKYLMLFSQALVLIQLVFTFLKLYLENLVITKKTVLTGYNQ